MGASIENCEVIAHRERNATVSDFRLHIHRGSPPIDDTSPGYNQDAHDDLKTEAAVSQAAFDQAVEDISVAMENWYSGKPSGVKEAFRGIYNSL